MGLLDTLAQAFTGRRNFQRTMQGLAGQLGLTFVPNDEDDDDDMAGLVVPYDGVAYTLIAGCDGDKVRLHVLSNIRFRPGGLPAEIARGLADRNRKLPRFDWDALDGKRAAYFFVKAQTRLAALDAELLRSALHEMVPEVAAFDAVLKREGYVA